MKKKLLFLGMLFMYGATLFAAPEKKVARSLHSENTQWECVICYENEKDLTNQKKSIVTLPCKHKICSPCFVKILSSEDGTSKCPYCRAIVNKSELSASGEELNRQIFLKEKYRLTFIERDVRYLIKMRSIICLFMGISLLMYVSDENEYRKCLAGLGTGMAVFGGLFLLYSEKVSERVLCACYPGIVHFIDQGIQNDLDEGEDPMPTLQLEDPIPDL